MKFRARKIQNIKKGLIAEINNMDEANKNRNIASATKHIGTEKFLRLIDELTAVSDFEFDEEITLVEIVDLVKLKFINEEESDMLGGCI